MGLAHLYRGMLTTNTDRGDALTPEMQMRIHQYATKTRDGQLLAKLAHYTGLTPEVDALLRASDELVVLTAWATRPGRSGEELSARLLADKRVAALLPLAALADLGDSVYRTIARIDSTKLAEALAGNTSVPLDIRTAKIRQLVVKSPRGAYNDHVGGLHKLCRCSGPNTPEQERKLYETVADHTKVIPYIIACLAKPYVRESDLDKWIDRLADYHNFDDRNWQTKTGNLVTALAAQPLSPGQRLRLLVNAEALVQANVNGWYTHDLRRAVEALGAFDENVAKAFSELDAATTAEEFDERLAALKSICSKEDLPKVAAICARNPLAGPVAIMGIFAHMNVRDDLPKLASRLEHSGDVETLTVLMELGSRENHPPMLVRSLANPDPVLDRYVENVTARGELLPNWFAETPYIKKRPSLMVESLHWSKLAHLIEKDQSLIKCVEEAMTGRLKDANTAWEALNTLSENFEGSLLDLVGAAQAL